MNRTTALVVVTVTFMLCMSILGIAAAHNEAPNLVSKASAATHMVRVKGSDGYAYTGTAFHIGGGYLVTAGHVVDNATVVVVGNKPAHVVKWEYIEVAPGKGIPTNLDWAVLFAPKLKGEPSLALDCGYTPSFMAEVLVMGYPNGQGMGSRGILQWAAETHLEYTMFPRMPAGSSGGALIDSASGLVIGIHVLGGPDGRGGVHTSFATRVSAVESLCPSAPEKETRKVPLGIRG